MDNCPSNPYVQLVLGGKIKLNLRSIVAYLLVSLAVIIPYTISINSPATSEDGGIGQAIAILAWAYFFGIVAIPYSFVSAALAIAEREHSSFAIVTLECLPFAFITIVLVVTSLA